MSISATLMRRLTEAAFAFSCSFVANSPQSKKQKKLPDSKKLKLPEVRLPVRVNTAITASICDDKTLNWTRRRMKKTKKKNKM
jgi:hypothetical protein